MTDRRLPPGHRRQVVEENVAPPHKDLAAAPPMARKPTPIGMPAPSAAPVRRESHDDLERVMEAERFERERAVLLVKLQDAEQVAQEATAAKDAALREVSQLREPAAPFPPLSVPPPAPKVPPSAPTLHEVKITSDIKALEKVVVSSRLGRAAITLGIMIALAWNAFNSVRQKVPEQKVEAVRERQKQNEQLSIEGLEAQALERERNLRRMRAIECWAKQLRGASHRQGLDLPSLPPGGVTAVKLGDEDPNRPGPPRFIAAEKCPDFPPLPPDTAMQ